MTRPEWVVLACIAVLSVAAFIKADRISRQLNRGNYSAPASLTI